MKLTKPATATSGRGLCSWYGATLCQAWASGSLSLSFVIKGVGSFLPWELKSTDEAGRFDDESLWYSRVAPVARCRAAVTVLRQELALSYLASPEAELPVA